MLQQLFHLTKPTGYSIIEYMKLIAQVKLKPTPEQAALLKDTLEKANAACNYLSAKAWESKTFGQFALHKLSYYEIKKHFGLSAQVVVRVIAKVSDAYALNKKRLLRFKNHGSIAYDRRILSWKMPKQSVSIWTTGGRQLIAFVCGQRQMKMLESRQGEADLVWCGGKWFLLQVCNVIEPPPKEAKDYLGIDLGVANIAATSDGKVLSGRKVNALRRWHRALRRKLQKKGTTSARRLLKKRRRKETRFARHVNHCISKRIVAMAERTSRGIAIEKLDGIRKRIKARKPQRAALHSWSFGQLRSFIEYKAALCGVPVVTVNPAYTSQTCPKCQHISRSNRPEQSVFKCQSCGFSGHADCIAAENIRMAAVNQPNVARAVA